jgi:flagellin-like protein
MQLKQLLSDDDAVSPVIGVILMVAITVILAAVIATFVLGLGEQVSDTAPQASFTFEFSENATDAGMLTITHDGGDSIKQTELLVRGRNGSTGGSSGNYNAQWDEVRDTTPSVVHRADGSVSGEIADTSAIVAGDFLKFPINTDGELRIVYQAQRGDTSATLATWEGPDA